MAVLTMEVRERHARTRAITRVTVSAANWRYPEARDTSRDVALSFLMCPFFVRALISLETTSL
jgi:hypothetical protein